VSTRPRTASRPRAGRCTSTSARTTGRGRLADVLSFLSEPASGGVAERPSCARRTVGKPLAEPVRPATPVLLVDCPLVDATAAFRARDVLFADGPEVGCAHRQGLGIAPSEVGRLNARLEPLCLAH